MVYDMTKPIAWKGETYLAYLKEKYKTHADEAELELRPEGKSRTVQYFRLGWLRWVSNI